MLTDGAASMRADKVDLCLGNGSHTNLIKGTSEESCKSAAEDDVSVPATEADSNAAQVLLSNEALDVAIVERFLVRQGKGGVLGVAIQSHDSLVILTQLDQSISIRLASGNLKANNPLKQHSPSIDACLTFSPSL